MLSILAAAIRRDKIDRTGFRWPAGALFILRPHTVQAQMHIKIPVADAAGIFICLNSQRKGMFAMRHGKLQIQIMPDAAIQNADLRQNRAFLHQVEEALLLGLVGQGKLTREQYDRCARALSEKAEEVLPERRFK